jgi:hypothetical protein
MPTETKGLSIREKRLLIFLGAFAFTAVMVMFVIVPWFNQLDSERGILRALETEKTRVDVLLASEQNLLYSYDAAVSQYNEIKSRFVSESHISEVGRMLTRICQEHNLSPIDQRLSGPVAFSEGNMILVVSAAMSVLGTYEDLKNLLDTIEQTEYLRVSRMSFAVRGEMTSAERISLSFEVIMIREM